MHPFHLFQQGPWRTLAASSSDHYRHHNPITAATVIKKCQFYTIPSSEHLSLGSVSWQRAGLVSELARYSGIYTALCASDQFSKETFWPDVVVRLNFSFPPSWFNWHLGIDGRQHFSSCRLIRWQFNRCYFPLTSLIQMTNKIFFSARNLCQQIFVALLFNQNYNSMKLKRLDFSKSSL